MTEKEKTSSKEIKSKAVETPKIEKEKAKNVKKESEVNKKEEASETKEEKNKTKPKIKKTEASVNSHSLPISTKQSVAICKFIKGKKIEKAINDLEKVIILKKSVPMKGEIPHRKGPGKTGSGSGRFPKNASISFIKLLKSLSANAIVNEIDNPVIVEAVANLASRPLGRFGRVQRKRTHVKIKAIEKKLISNKQTKKKK